MGKMMRYVLLVVVMIAFGVGVHASQAQDGGDVRRIAVPGIQFDARLSPDGHTLAIFENGAVHSDEVEARVLPIRLIDLTSGEERLLTGQTDYAVDVAFSPDGTKLVSSHGGGYLSLWDVATSAEIKRIPALPGARRLAYLPDGQSVAVGFPQQPFQITVWDTANDVITHVLAIRYPTALDFRNSVGEGNIPDGLGMFTALPDGSGLIVVTHRGNIWVWPFASDQPRVLLQSENDLPIFNIQDVRITADGTTIVFYDRSDKQMHWLDLATGTEINVLPIDTIAIPYVSSDGQKVLWLTADNTLQIWDTAQTDAPTEITLPPLLTEHFGLSSPLHLTPDGSHVVLSGFLALTGENEIWVIDLP